MFGFTASRTQIAAYLFGVALFSISFLVFLNSALSFVITQRIGQTHGVGDAVGTLGFADELVALIACPAWGMLSDRVGVRAVAVMGYSIVGVSLWIFVQAKNVYPQLLLARIFFSLGATATATMVTAILPTMTLTKSSQDPRVTQPPNGTSHAATPSISSELTITPARLQSHSPQPPLSTKGDSAASASRLAGVVGSFTGCGALVALLVFLPLPTLFQRRGHSPATAVADAFYVVGAIALLVAAAVFLGLRNLPGEEGKGPRRLLRYSTPKEGEGHTPVQTVLSLPRQFLASIALGLKSRNIGLAYLGGFVARSSSVAISLYIPLFTYHYFLRTGQCSADPQDPLDVKLSCARAYKLAAALTGVSQFIALVAAPLFGFISARYPRYNIPLLSSALAGVVGYSVFGALDSPDPRSTEGSGAVFLVVSLLGFSQIGAIVCSLGLLARGIHSDGEIDAAPEPQRYFHSEGHHQSRDATPSVTPATEEAPLLSDPLRPRHTSPAATDLNHLKGSIAGTYSLFGGVGILILTKAGGALFDSEGPGSPFFMMASFNAVLLVVGAALAIYEFIRDRSASSQHSV